MRVAVPSLAVFQAPSLLPAVLKLKKKVRNDHSPTHPAPIHPCTLLICIRKNCEIFPCCLTDRTSHTSFCGNAPWTDNIDFVEGSKKRNKSFHLAQLAMSGGTARGISANVFPAFPLSSLLSVWQSVTVRGERLCVSWGVCHHSHEQLQLCLRSHGLAFVDMQSIFTFTSKVTPVATFHNVLDVHLVLTLIND